MNKQVLLFIVVVVVSFVLFIYLPANFISEAIIEDLIESEEEVPADTTNRLM